MSIVCGCGRKVETQPEWAGQWITCPGCSGALYSPFPGPKPSAPTLPDVPVAAPTRLCPLCAETIPAAEPGCRYCGGTRPAPPRPAAPAPSSGSDTGIASLIVSLAGFLICGLLFPIGWYLGSSHESDCRRRGVAPSVAGKAGKIIGIIGTALMILGFGIFTLCCAVGR